MKKMDNKGFSLVELIVVVAIMAVLMTVLAPQYLKYVEKARLQKDNSAIAEIANAIKIAMADETINSAVGATVTITGEATDNKTNIKFTFASVTGGSTTYAEPTELYKELSLTIGDSFTTGSNTYKASDKDIVLTITKDSSGAVTISATGWIESVGGAPTGTTPEGGTAVPAKTF